MDQNTPNTQPTENQQIVYVQRPSIIDEVYGKCETTLEKALKILSLTLFAFAALYIFIDFIDMIIYFTKAYSDFWTGFRSFLLGSIGSALRYCFFGAVLAGIKKLISK